MALGNRILVNADDAYRGRRFQGILSGALYPGTCVQFKAATEPDGNGHYTFEAYNRVIDANRYPVMVLLMDRQQGFIATTQYTSGDLVEIYVPLPGDELNMLCLDVSGTADDKAIADLFSIDDGTGKLIATIGTSGQGTEAEPFVCMETITDPTADHLVHCMFTGY